MSTPHTVLEGLRLIEDVSLLVQDIPASEIDLLSLPRVFRVIPTSKQCVLLRA